MTNSAATLDNNFNEVTIDKEVVTSKLKDMLADQLKMDAEKIDVHQPFTSYGLDSIDAFTMTGDIEDWLSIELPSALFWDYTQIDEVAHYISSNFAELRS